MNLLLLSSSRVGNQDYLDHPKPHILKHLEGCTNIVFVYYAGVAMSPDEYCDKVREALPELPIKGLHQFQSPIDAIKECDAIMIGGGNTFNLLHELYQNGLVEAIREKVAAGTPYVGWSAGSNVAGNSIRTTNDMPIIEPFSFTALQLVPFQINPHYTDYQAPGHNGETRAERLQEFMVLNPTMPIIAIPEGTHIAQSGNSISYEGNEDGFVFLGGEKQPLSQGVDLSRYL